MSEDLSQFAIDAVECGADEAWTLTIEGSVGTLTRASRRPNGQVQSGTVEVRTIRLGELLMHMRSPMLEIFCENSLRVHDEAPANIRKLVHAHGPRVLQLWQDGFEAEDIVETLGV